MTNAGQPPRVIRSVIQQSDPQLSLRLSDIYNARAKYRLLAGRTPIQALLENLILNDAFHRHKTDENGHVTHLFIAHSTSISLFCQHHDIFLLDCTYRINRYKMSLLNIAGATGMNTTLQLALVFLCAEIEEDYTWALTSLQVMLSSDGNSPSVIVTDRERALISACQTIFLLKCITFYVDGMLGKMYSSLAKNTLQPKKIGKRFMLNGMQLLIALPRKSMRFS